MEKFPRQGTRAPWRLYQNYARDLAMIRFAALEDGVLELGVGKRAARRRAVQAERAVTQARAA